MCNTYRRYLPKELAAALQAARQRYGFSVREVAGFAGIDGSYLGRLERAEACPSLPVARNLVSVLELDEPTIASLLEVATTDTGRARLSEDTMADTITLAPFSAYEGTARDFLGELKYPDAPARDERFQGDWTLLATIHRGAGERDYKLGKVSDELLIAAVAVNEAKRYGTWALAGREGEPIRVRLDEHFGFLPS